MPRIKLNDDSEADNNYFTSSKSNLEFIDAGCAVLNCTLGGGWPLGRISNIVGDFSTGKCGNFWLHTKEGLVHTDDIGADRIEGISEWVKCLALDSKKSVYTSHFYKEK